MASRTSSACENTASAYDGIGWFYNRYWRRLPFKAVPALEKLAVGLLPRGARILDLCCGTGHIAAALGRRGFRVTGVDGSADMIRFARANAPHAAFVIADARRFRFQACFDLAISTFDSLNHVLSARELSAVMRNVYHVLVGGGRFVFDLNMAEAFETEWRKSSAIVEPDHICLVRGGYDRQSKLGRTEVTTFRLADTWKRSDLMVYQRCYSRAQVKAALGDAGFIQVAAHTAQELGMRGRLAVGRVFFTARKPGRSPRRTNLGPLRACK
jgi:SAM-dependent methyltransferase